MQKRNNTNGFTLIEIAIGIVIIGVLLGLTLTVLDAIRGAKLSNVASDFQNLNKALDYYNSKYRCVGGTDEEKGNRRAEICACSRENVNCLKNPVTDEFITNKRTGNKITFALPGDMQNAAVMWGEDATSNGNGSGKVDTDEEKLLFWQHLSLAKVVQGKYSGTGDDFIIADGMEGNISKSSISGAGYAIDFIQDTSKLPGGSNNGHFLTFGSPSGDFELGDPVIEPTEALTIDTKIDDGIAGTGYLRGLNSIYDEDCLSAEDLSEDSRYQVENEDTVCRLMFFLSNWSIR